MNRLVYRLDGQEWQLYNYKFAWQVPFKSGRFCIKIVNTSLSCSCLIWQVPFSRTSCQNLPEPASLLDIYISQKTRMCAVNLEDQFQTCLVAKLINFFDLKIQIYYIHFSAIFCRSCEIQCFLHTVAAIPKSWSI